MTGTNRREPKTAYQFDYRLTVIVEAEDDLEAQNLALLVAEACHLDVQELRNDFNGCVDTGVSSNYLTFSELDEHGDPIL